MKIWLYLLTGLFIVFSINCYAQETKTTVAVMDLEAQEGVSQGVANVLSDSLRAYLVNTEKFTIVTRENMQQVLKEQNFQVSGITQESVAKIGQILGVEKIFTGSIGRVGTTYVINLKLVDVQSGRIEKAATEECRKDEQDALLVSVKNAANKVLEFKPDQSVVSKPVAPKVGSYEVVTIPDGAHSITKIEEAKSFIFPATTATKLELGFVFPSSFIYDLNNLAYYSSSLPIPRYRYGISLDYWNVLSNEWLWGFSGSFSLVQFSDEGYYNDETNYSIISPSPEQQIIGEFQLGYNTKLFNLELTPKIATGIFVHNYSADFSRQFYDFYYAFGTTNYTDYGIDINLGADLKICEAGPFYFSLDFSNRFIWFFANHNQSSWNYQYNSGSYSESVDEWHFYMNPASYTWSVGVKMGGIQAERDKSGGEKSGQSQQK